MHDPRFVALLILSPLLDFLVGVALLGVIRRRREPRRPPINFARFAISLIATAIFAAMKLFALIEFGLDVFGAMHLVFLDIAVIVPLLGATLLACERIPRGGQSLVQLTRLVRIAAICSLSIIPVTIDATLIEPRRLQLERAELRLSPKRSGSSDVRIGILADIQTDRVSDHERRAVDWMMQQKPDILLLPGDLHQGTLDQFDAAFDGLRDLLFRLDAPGGVYFVMGDSDHVDRIKRLFAGTPVQLLLNRVVRTTVGDRSVLIGGIELSHTRQGARRAISELESTPGQEDIRILLSHRPDVVLTLWRDSRIDLVVAGHTHGGQVTLPFFGPIVTFSAVPRRVAAGGLHWCEGHPVYVSRGVGLERSTAPRIRFLCPPEISLLTLKSTSR